MFIDDEDEGFVNPINVFVRANPPEEFDPSEQCGVYYFTCGVVVGVGLFGEGAWDLLKLVGTGILISVEAEGRYLSWVAEMLPVVANAILLDEAAQAKLVQEIVIDLQALADTGAFGVQIGADLAVAVKDAMVEGLDNLSRDSGHRRSGKRQLHDGQVHR